jgi:hypothetical protein
VPLNLQDTWVSPIPFGLGGKSVKLCIGARGTKAGSGKRKEIHFGVTDSALREGSEVYKG